MAAPNAKIGFHVAYEDGVEKRESGMGNAMVGLYIGELGYSDNVVQYVTTAPPDDMQWLSSRDAALLGIEVFTHEELPAGSRQIEVTSSSDEATALEFVERMIRTHADSSTSALALVARYYAPSVSYYGKTRPLREVYADKEAYFARWPSRSTEIDPTSLRAACVDSKCVVQGNYHWSVSSFSRAKSASGLARFTYFLTLKPEIAILVEDGKVIRRD